YMERGNSMGRGNNVDRALAACHLLEARRGDLADPGTNRHSPRRELGRDEAAQARVPRRVLEE
ncbi:MAG: hypothetical protein ACRD0B_10210, partial [Acidimicrobiales bacterium]